MSAPTSTASAAAQEIVRLLTTPELLPAEPGWRAQSLSKGAAGVALLHIERAHSGEGSWQTAHSWVTATARDGVSVGDDANLLFGAPALAFVLHAAGADGTVRYGPARTGVDTSVTALTHRRVDLAHARIDRGELPAFAEYDLLHGLTGLGAHLLQHAAANDALQRVLTYLVRLTKPLRVDDETLPGWWVFHDPQVKQSDAFRGGHGNFGIAHGIAGPLALLAQARRRGVTVDGHDEALHMISTWLDTWRQHADSGPWWPQWITRDQLRTGRPDRSAPMRPSWCYGTPGLARAQQLAAIATTDIARQQMAEHALVCCLSDPDQLSRITDISLCHGWAGLYQTVWRAGRDACAPEVSGHVPALADRLIQQCRAGLGEDIGLLEGTTGLALALHTAARTTPPVSGWDACLLIN
ncbi:lanthionine synthetase C family protein [Streptomyces ipomoeae]|uniref:lanthionine synthetase C family protein n=1 Tax=Streptomyces ipomoeae TaxID=103232 RepID=UPI0029B3522D|nr:lanthionine synthetase C family protein [Streptomyces ipomoeae]MDX2822301.1 lanthionine synthetase C family protein [Streptomyces ipomoeae]MDX2875845.1 lanthionine synthetase C family protein [Streptomyces ipomoeae]